MDILAVYKSSLWELYSNSPDERTRRFALARKEPLERNHRSHKETVDEVVNTLSQGNTLDIVHRSALSEGIARNKDLVVSLGGDGTVLDVSHYVWDTPIIGINSSPDSSVGYFCCAQREDFREWLEPEAPSQMVYRLITEIDGERVSVPALNDVQFKHRCPGATTRYELEHERVKGSGLLVASPVGSTALIYEEGGTVMSVAGRQLQYLNMGTRARRGHISDAVRMTSHTREGKVFIDGAYVEYDAGLDQVVNISLGAPIRILGDLQQKQDEMFNHK